MSVTAPGVTRLSTRPSQSMWAKHLPWSDNLAGLPFDRLPVAAEHFAFSDQRLVVAGGSEVVLLSDDGDVHATWTAAHRIEGLVASGRSIWVRAGGIDTRLDATGDRLAPVSTVTTVDTALEFSPGPHPGSLLRRSNDNQLELWAVTRHQLRRDQFKQAFTMRNPTTRAAH